MKKSTLKIADPLLPKLADWTKTFPDLEQARSKRKQELIDALRAEKGFVARAAERLGLSRSRVVLLIGELGLQGFVDEQRKKRRGS